MKKHITDRAIKAMPLPDRGSKIIYDDVIPGFGVRFTANGAISFILNYRIDGRERRITIGKKVDWSSEAARDEALDLRRQITKGIDPLDEREKRSTAPTVKELTQDYLNRHAKIHKRERSQKSDESLIDNYVIPKLGRKKVANVRRYDIENLHQSLKDTPIQANRLLALLSKMFTLATHWDLCEKNPCKGVTRFYEEKRERYLTGDELRALVQALNKFPKFTTKAGEEKTDKRKEQSANIIRLLLLTGARRNEVMSAKWKHFDIEDGVWTKPSSHTKQKRTHRIPLSAPAKLLLVELNEKAGESPYIFPGPTPDTHQGDIKNAWASICKLAKIKDLRIHDLRHSYASQLAAAGLSLPIIGALLGHTQPATTARYAHLIDDPLRQATEKVGAIVIHAGTGKTAEILPIDSKK